MWVPANRTSLTFRSQIVSRPLQQSSCEVQEPNWYVGAAVGGDGGGGGDEVGAGGRVGAPSSSRTLFTASLIGANCQIKTPAVPSKMTVITIITGHVQHLFFPSRGGRIV